jgi:hypothetical protein
MNLQKVYPEKPHFYYTCTKCDKTRYGNAYADLDGDPFKSYYCSGCVADNDNKMRLKDVFTNVNEVY